jgi:UDP-N-acetylmuramoyl-L-alanyl-D-glutamate--2,6-diaminopimelate ligase
LDALIYTNLEPEHIESHGSYENYRAVKKSIIVNSLEKSKKKNRSLVVNRDDKESGFFLLDSHVEEKKTYGIEDVENLNLTAETIDFDLDQDHFHSELSGEFNAYNLLACITLGKHLGLASADIQNAVKKFNGIPGRVQRIDAGQDFTVIVDYAHTPQSLEKLYETFAESKRICVLGNTGGGRDTWKRPKMASIAARHCSEIILTNEDPYDEDPQKIIDEMKEGISDTACQTIMDRRQAIAAAIAMAKTGDSVLITGKGTDPYIMGANGSKLEWSDARVARGELETMLKNKQ